MKIVEKLLAAVQALEVRQATAYLSKSYTMKLTRQCKPTKRDTRQTFILTFGVPNYLEREFICKCKKAGEPFPVKKIQLKLWPKRKNK